MTDDENDYAEVPWTLELSSNPSSRAIAALAKAYQCAQAFNKHCDLYNSEREKDVPKFDPNELILGEKPLRFVGFQSEYELNEISVDTEGFFTEREAHFASRSDQGCYSVKFLQEGIIDQDHAENALTEMIRESKILMSISPHPNLNTIYGLTSKGIDSLLESGRNGYFFITDRIAETLEDRLDSWRRHFGSEPLITERLDTALDIASALVYLHDRKLVYHVRPDKVGFGVRHGQIKLCDFGQVVQHGLPDHPRGITQSDNIRVLAYTAPEVFSSSPVHLGSDVYAFGVMLWEMVTLESAFAGFDRPAHFQHVVRSNQMPLEVDESLDKDIAEAMKSCWHYHRRPKMKTMHLVLETALLMNDIREPSRRSKPKRQASVETVNLSESEDNAPVPCSEQSGPTENLEVARSTGSDCSKTVQTRQSRSSKRSDSSRGSSDSKGRRGRKVTASFLHERASTPEPYVSPHRAKPTTQLGRSASCSSVFFEAEPEHSLHRRASSSHSVRSRHSSKSPHRSKPPDRSRRAPKASKSMPELQSPEKKERSSKTAPGRSSSGRDRYHAPRTPSSRSNSKSPGIRKSASERFSTPKHRSSGKHHGHRESSKSPRDPSEKNKKHHQRKRSSSRGKSEPKKNNISMEELEQFLFSSGAKLPTSPGGTVKKPKILVRKPSVNESKVSRQKTDQEEGIAFPSLADLFFDSPPEEDPFVTSPLGEENPPSETPIMTLSPSNQKRCVRSAPSRTTSDQSDVRSRSRKTNLLDVRANSGDFFKEETFTGGKADCSAAMKELHQSILAAPSPSKGAQSPMKRMLGGLKSMVSARDKNSCPPQLAPETQPLSTAAIRTRRSSVVMGLVDEHQQNRAKSASPAKSSRRTSSDL